ncbi:Hypothetical predicted protein [Olea europaea subsp. europaea]|uniref:Uncharacterized protein n=1 Tax=Olea europaea subsp. europaea TaxID=158383 RepID=A0A8S0PL13_OLEEU|nr:Hypothetical predicted protein [Olea europaea subsp. europaea]
MHFCRATGKNTSDKGNPVGTQNWATRWTTWQHEESSGSPNTAFKISTEHFSKPFRAAKHGTYPSIACATSDSVSGTRLDIDMADVTMQATMNNTKAPFTTPD